jgi:hypothetical protein
MTYFDIPDRWELPDYIWRQSFEEMAIDGARGCEGIALWLGKDDGETTRATQVVMLRGPGVVKRPNQLLISADLMNVVADLAIDLGLALIGQIHSHSPLASIDLSYPDRYLGITAPGYLSLVAPDFALGRARKLADCGVHLHEGDSGWRRLSAHEVAQRFTQPVRAPLPPLVAQVKE